MPGGCLATRQTNNSITAALDRCIGIFFTLTYAAAVQAGVAAWFERMDAAPAAPPGASPS